MSKAYQSIFRENLFAEQVILVTGGGTGIGRAIAHELGSLGMGDRSDRSNRDGVRRSS